MDVDIHGYIHEYIHRYVWISDLGHAIDICMDISYRYLICNITNSI